MFKITLPADRAVTDMAAVANAFGIGIQDLQDGIHTGTISRWRELGEGHEDNKPHQILASANLGFRVDVDEHGQVCSTTRYPRESTSTRPKWQNHRDTGQDMEANDTRLIPEK